MAEVNGEDEPLSSRLLRFDRLVDGEITLAALLSVLHERGHALFALFLVVPFLQPVPLPGVSTVFGLAIAVVGVLMALGRPLWLPRRLRERRLERVHVRRIIEAAGRLLRKFERFVRPRGQSLHSHPLVQRTVGATMALSALLMALPLPIPLSNFLPALTVALLAVGTVEEDIVVLALAFLSFACTLAFFAALVLAPGLLFG